MGTLSFWVDTETLKVMDEIRSIYVNKLKNKRVSNGDIISSALKCYLEYLRKTVV